VSQQLLLPEQVEVELEKIDVANDMKEELLALGFDYDVSDEGALSIRALPALLKDANPTALFNEILALEEDPAWSGVISEMIDAVVARIACHGSVRSGRMLQNDEVYPLLEALDEVESSAYCPHGRPIVHHLTRHELESMFGRIQ
jgi:DNA mismatch repair protein MutL